MGTFSAGDGFKVEGDAGFSVNSGFEPYGEADGFGVKDTLNLRFNVEE